METAFVTDGRDCHDPDTGMMIEVAPSQTMEYTRNAIFYLSHVLHLYVCVQEVGVIILYVQVIHTHTHTPSIHPYICCRVESYAVVVVVQPPTHKTAS